MLDNETEPPRPRADLQVSLIERGRAREREARKRESEMKRGERERSSHVSVLGVEGDSSAASILSTALDGRTTSASATTSCSDSATHLKRR